MRLCVFASGSSGNCALLSSGNTHLLLDAGISFRRIKENLALSGLRPEALAAVLITHEHADHIAGLATMLKQCGVLVYAPSAAARSLRRSIPGAEGRVLDIPADAPLRFGDLTAHAFQTPHDADGSVGWRITDGRDCFALATDMGHVTEEIRAGLLGADTVLIEANHDLDMLRFGPYPVALKRRILSDFGHLSNDGCAALAAFLAQGGTKRIVLGHLSRENNTPAAALRTVRAALTGRDTEVYAAPAAERFTLEWEASPCSV